MCNSSGKKTPYTIRRKEQGGYWVLVGWVDNALEIGPVIDEDRKKIDYEAEYKAEPDRE